MLDETVCHTLAGALGGTVGAVLTCPLEVVKVRLQSSKGSQLSSVHPNGPNLKNLNKSRFTILSSLRRPIWMRSIEEIYQKEGIKALYKGLLPTIFGVLPSRAVYFSVYHSGQEFYSQYFDEGSHPIFLLSAMTASLIGSTITNPIWFVKTKLQLSGTNCSIRDIIRSTLKLDGITGFYRGISASYIGSLETAINYMVYEELKSRLLTYKRQRELDVLSEEYQLSERYLKKLEEEYRRLEDINFLLSMETTSSKWWWPLPTLNSHMKNANLKAHMQSEMKANGVSVVEVELIDAKAAHAELARIKSEIEITSKELKRMQVSMEETTGIMNSNLKGSLGGSKLQSTIDMLVCCAASMFSKVVAITSAYPHEVVRTRLRESTGEFKGFFTTLNRIYKTEGLNALYRGLSTHYVRQVPNQVIVITAYEGFVFAFHQLGLVKPKG